MNFKAVLALPKTAGSAQTPKSISFIWIVWSTLYVYLCRRVKLKSDSPWSNIFLKGVSKNGYVVENRKSAHINLFSLISYNFLMVYKPLYKKGFNFLWYFFCRYYLSCCHDMNKKGRSSSIRASSWKDFNKIQQDGMFQRPSTMDLQFSRHSTGYSA